MNLAMPGPRLPLWWCHLILQTLLLLFVREAEKTGSGKFNHLLKIAVSEDLSCCKPQSPATVALVPQSSLNAQAWLSGSFPLFPESA